MTEIAIHQTDFRSVTTAVVERLKENRRVRRNLPGGGRIKIDRQLPFLCVYRIPPGDDEPVARHLVTTEAAYLIAQGDERYRDDVTALCDEINAVVQEHFDAFLLIEVWTEEHLRSQIPHAIRTSRRSESSQETQRLYPRRSTRWRELLLN